MHSLSTTHNVGVSWCSKATWNLSRNYMGTWHYKVSSTLIDHIYVNHIEWYNKVGGFEYGGSDHKLVYIIRKRDKKLSAEKR